MSGKHAGVGTPVRPDKFGHMPARGQFKRLSPGAKLARKVLDNPRNGGKLLLGAALAAPAIKAGAKALLKKDAGPTGHDAFLSEVSKVSPNAVAGLTRVAAGGQGRAETIYARSRLRLRDASASAKDPVKTKARTEMKNALSQKSPYRSYGKVSGSAARAAGERPGWRTVSPKRLP